MRSADDYDESLFNMVRLKEFVPRPRLLCQVRTWLNEALSKIDAKFSAMYKDDERRGRPGSMPEKLMRVHDARPHATFAWVRDTCLRFASR